jgi:hypothetical protein
LCNLKEKERRETGSNDTPTHLQAQTFGNAKLSPAKLWKSSQDCFLSGAALFRGVPKSGQRKLSICWKKEGGAPKV